MEPVSRRSFLVRGSAGVAGAAAMGSAGLIARPAGAAPLSDEELDSLDRPALVHIRDAAKGEVEVLVGEREVVFVDHSLVANVLRAAR